ncbi:MAG: hypothetical protein IKW02_03550 [Clostridia bacterium]|nr:hypothetical protein [Clostridia bacterium]
MTPVKQQKVLKFNKKTETRKNASVAGKLIILAIAVIFALLVSQWSEFVSLFPKMDNKVYKVAQTDMGQHIIHSFGDKSMAYIGKNGLVVMDKKGREKFSVSMIMDSPSIAVSDSKIVFAPKGKNTIFTVSSSGKLSDFKTEDEIINLKLSDSGNIVAITNKKTYNGSAMVYSHRGEPLFSWDAGTCNLLDATLSPDGRKLAVSVIYTGGNEMECSVMLFDIEKSESPYSEKSTGTNFISSINWADNNTLVIVGDRKLCAVNGKGADKWEYDYEGKRLAAFSADEKNNIVIALGHSSLDKEFYVYSFNANGRKQGEYLFDNDVKTISANENRILVTSSSGAHLINKHGRLRDKVTSEKYIYGGYLYKSGNKVLLDKGGFTEIIEMK